MPGDWFGGFTYSLLHSKNRESSVQSHTDFWEAEVEEWGKSKMLKLKESGKETDPEKRVSSKMNHLSAYDFYHYKWW